MLPCLGIGARSRDLQVRVPAKLSRQLECPRGSPQGKHLLVAGSFGAEEQPHIVLLEGKSCHLERVPVLIGSGYPL